MQSDKYIGSKIVNDEIDNLIKGLNDDFSESQIRSIIKGMLIEAFNAGIISNFEEKKKLKSETIQKKSKEITSFLPAHFKGTETGRQLTGRIQETILANTTDYVLNVGYEPILEDDVNKVLQIAYSVGITTGFEIASDPDMKSIYNANVERFMRSGTEGNN